MASLRSATEALEAGSWAQARAEFRDAADQTADPAAFEGIAAAAWWLDDAATCVGARESAYRRYRDLGDDLGAARAATALAWDTLLFGHGEAVALGWLGRAADLLAPIDESAEHGWLAIREAEIALEVQHDPDRALAAAQRATGIAQRGDHGGLEVVGLALEGLALTAAGRVDAGMAKLDVSVAAATSGDVSDPMWMGKVCCWLIAACHETKDVARAGEWCRRVEALCIERDLVPLFNVCRIQYASVQIDRGAWPEAEHELGQVLERLSDSRRGSRLEAVVQLGELRRRQGRYSEADALFMQAEFNPLSIAGRARIRFATGDIAGAWASIRRLLDSLPPDSSLARAEVLLPAVQIALAAGEIEAARRAAQELRATAERARKDPLLAMAAIADAALADPGDVVALLAEAVRRFSEAGLDYDGARARVSLAAALLAAADEGAAREQLERAIAALTELDAGPDLAQARHLAAAVGLRVAGPLTTRELEVLGLVANGLSNQEIASELVVSEHTVHRHVANILAKLGQPSRTAAVANAINAGLL